MSKVTKCDGCHEEKPLHLFKNIVNSGFTAYCWDCAVKCGKFTGISKIDMIRDELDYYQELLIEIKIKRTKLLEQFSEEMSVQ